MSSYRQRKKQNGTGIAETAAAMALLVPLVFLMFFAIAEATQAYLIVNGLAQGAREAARDLAIAYGQNQSVSTDRSLQNSMAFDSVRINNIINSSSQFEDPTFQTNNTPQTVTVTVDYSSNQYGLPKFPSFDPLKIGNSFQLKATSTYGLQ